MNQYLQLFYLMWIVSCQSIAGFLITSYGRSSGILRNAKTFSEEVTTWLDSEDVSFQELDNRDGMAYSPFRLLGVAPKQPQEGNDFSVRSGSSENYKIILHILPTPTSDPSTQIESTLCKKLTDSPTLHAYCKTIIHLHQDVWNNKKDIAQTRILAKLGRVKRRWYARNTTVRRIDRNTAISFLEANHLWGATQSKFNYGLFSKEKELVAVATFSPRRHVNRFIGQKSQRPYRSHELIRYSSVRDGHCTGGITKLVAAFVREHAPDDIITCIDRDWGDGSGWQNIGFVRVGVMPPLIMAVGDDGVRRYCVGSGIGSKDGNSTRTSRQGINATTWKDLNEATTIEGALDCLASHRLHPVFDAGVERRILLVTDSKLNAQASQKRVELGLDELPSGLDAFQLWNNSNPSFPCSYYVKNNGLNLLLKSACRRQK